MTRHRTTTQTAPYWSVVAMRPQTPSTNTWHLERYATAGGAPWPRCNTNPGAGGWRVSDASGWILQFVATDYNSGGEVGDAAGRRSAAGVYFGVLDAGGERRTRKIVLRK